MELPLGASTRHNMVSHGTTKPAQPAGLASGSASTSKSARPTKKQHIDDMPTHITDTKRNISYARGKLLGKGGFAYCYLLTDERTGEQLAGKVVDKTSLKKEKTKKKLFSEIKIHSELDHKYVVKFRNFFEDKKRIYMVLDLCHNHSMMELIKRRKRLTEREVAYYMAQIVDGVDFLHKQRVIHRDLKLGNLFLTNKLEVKIGDFGLATKLMEDSERRKTVCGTPNYIAPEVLDGKHNGGHSYEVDVWSIGVIMFTLLCGKPPFETSNVKATYKRIRASCYAFPTHVPLSESAKALIAWTLSRTPETRPTLEQLKNHSFLRNAPKCIPKEALVRPPRWDDLTNRMESLDVNDDENDYREVSGHKRRSRPSPAKPTRAKKALKADLGADLLAARDKLKAASLAGRKPSSSIAQSASPVKVLRFFDYRTKYGTGYHLSDGSMGVLFNDATKLIVDPQGTSFDYVPRSASVPAPHTSHYLYQGGYPSALEKKVTIMKRFRDYLEKQARKDNDGAPAARVVSKNNNNSSAKPHVRRWFKDDYVSVFCFSTSTVQIIFHDKSEIVVCPSKSDELWYRNKHGESAWIKLSECGAEDLSRRLKYAEDVLRGALRG